MGQNEKYEKELLKAAGPRRQTMSVTCHGSSEFPMRSSFSSDYHCTIEKPIISSRVITLSFQVVGNMSLGKLLEPGPDNLFLGTEHGYAAIPNAATTYSAKSDTLISGTMTFELPEDAPPEATMLPVPPELLLCDVQAKRHNCACLRRHY